MPPLCAFGFVATYWGWQNQVDVESNISAFRHGQYPLDAVVMDYDWFGTSKADYQDFGYNNMTMTNSRFPTLKSLLGHYHVDYNVRFGGIRKPVTYDHISLVHKQQDWALRWNSQQNELNFTTPGLRNWYINGTTSLVNDGVDFFW